MADDRTTPTREPSDGPGEGGMTGEPPPFAPDLDLIGHMEQLQHPQREAAALRRHRQIERIRAWLRPRSGGVR